MLTIAFLIATMVIIGVNNMKDLGAVKELLVVIDVINGFINEGNMMDNYIAHIIPSGNSEKNTAESHTLLSAGTRLTSSIGVNILTI